MPLYSNNALILASASPRRAELLRRAGIAFEVIVSPAAEPEHKPKSIPTGLWPMCLAFMKATAVQSKIKNQGGGKSKIKNPPTILAADTIVLLNNRILNKPRNRTHARQMLTALRGKTHRVITGIALLYGDRLRLSSAEAVCRVRRVSQTFITRYLDSGLWRGKAGGYGIQDAADPFVELLSGELSTVVGLPMSLVQRELASFRSDR